MGDARGELVGRRALVSGASSGLGRAFARELARRGAGLVLTARREERLQALAEELRSAHGVEVRVEALDLGAPGAAGELFTRTEGQGLTIDILVNNAGLGAHGDFLDRPFEDAAQQVRVNVLALLELSHRFGQAMRARRRGWILDVASFVADLPVPQMAVYAATKAFVRHLGDALAVELAPHGVKVCSLLPGGIDTEFFAVSGQGERIPGVMRLTMASPEQVARAGLAALFGWRRSVAPGLLIKLGLWSVRLMPRRLRAWLAHRIMGLPAAAQ
ncbi:MAG TPA: SDR family oxidoreductase [Myxococcota bacterium]|nr:SDR family oxidoreductase [Myxococcota bacterium]HRY95527.1 SDR family oxidoreductase [Myxococcota bacterium]HSA19929.1 SDR family oxidoreductase [Myxococcota bacterium]